MSPFQIDIELMTPMVIGRAPRLEGLLWHCLFLHLNSQSRAEDAVPDYLKMDESQRFYHASSMQFASSGAVPGRKKDTEVFDNLLGLSRSVVGVMRPGQDLSPDNFAPTSKRGSRYTKVIVAGGVYKNRLSHLNAYYARQLVFHGVGDGEAIADLLGFYLVAIGKNASSGFGTIGAVQSRPIEDDLSLIGPDGRPARPLPVDAYRQTFASDAAVLTGSAILTPPFRYKPETLCYLPERVRKIFTKHYEQTGETN